MTSFAWVGVVSGGAIQSTITLAALNTGVEPGGHSGEGGAWQSLSVGLYTKPEGHAGWHSPPGPVGAKPMAQTGFATEVQSTVPDPAPVPAEETGFPAQLAEMKEARTPVVTSVTVA